VSSAASAAASLDKVLGDLSRQTGPPLTSVGQTVTDIRQLIDNLDAVVEDVKTRAPDLLSSLQGTADAAREMAESGEKGLASLAGGMPLVQQQLTSALRELAAGMRSLSELADYLERHPEALLKGKSNPGGQ
jgi:paraquat-inducible protein B